MSFRITVNPGTVLTDLDNMSKKLQSSTEILQAGGKAGLTEAQNRVPVRTGFLRNSLYSEVSKNAVELGGRAEYTVFVEFGTYRMPARPFLRPGAEVAMKAINDALRRLI